MSGIDPRHSGRRTPSWRRAVVGLGALAATVLVGVVAGPSTGDTARARAAVEAPVASNEPRAAVAAVPGVRSGAVTPEGPRSVRLPSGRTVAVRPVGTTADGTLDVPADVDAAGWWREGSRIGDPFGSALVAAHVDSRTEGLGPFAELLGVRPGQLVVLTSEHLTQDYAVSELRLIDKDRLSDHAWVHSARGPHRLTLVTCAGPFDPDNGGYQRLAVVTATAVGAPLPGEAR
ncbi:MAG TPA: class F sortase [Nocardioides sp.]|nr:class F sortase [Nocardioides sp.]